MLSAPQGPEASFSLLCSDSSVSTPSLEMRQLNIYPAREVCPEAWPPSPAPTGSALPSPLPFLVHGEFRPKMASSPPPPALVEPPVQGIEEARRAGEGLWPWGHALVSPLLLDQQAAGASPRRDSANDCLLGGRSGLRVTKMELLAQGDDPGRQRVMYLHIISIIDYVSS